MTTKWEAATICTNDFCNRHKLFIPAHVMTAHTLCSHLLHPVKIWVGVMDMGFQSCCYDSKLRTRHNLQQGLLQRHQNHILGLLNTDHAVIAMYCVLSVTYCVLRMVIHWIMLFWPYVGQYSSYIHCYKYSGWLGTHKFSHNVQCDCCRWRQSPLTLNPRP